MIYYKIDLNGNIVAASTAPVPTYISSETVFSNPSDWKWNGTEFVQKPNIVEVTQHFISRSYELVIDLPTETRVIVYGPGIYHKEITDIIEFSSDKIGTFTFDVYHKDYKPTKIEVNVR